MAKLPWKPWHEVVKLREDLKSGELPLHLFAADLYEVLMQRGKQPIYEKPLEFFALTFPTYNLRQLTRDVVLRLAGKTLPWKTVRDVITGALHARFLEIAPGSGAWPCEFPAAQSAIFKVITGTTDGGSGGGTSGRSASTSKKLVADAELEPSEIQDLGDIMPDLLKLKAKMNIPFLFHFRIEMGDGNTPPSPEVAKEANKLLKAVKDNLQLR